jgi:uncharacterized hydrophobic protein (TIGR00341 family)
MLHPEGTMALRLIEMVCPEQKREEVEALAREHEPLGVWHDRFMDDQVMVRILLPAEKAEAVLDQLESRYSGMAGFRVLLLAVEAAIPRADDVGGAQAGPGDDVTPAPLPSRISRQELHGAISASARLTRIYLVMIALSSVVAAIGMWRDNVAVIIGAMVIAPLLGPNMALAFSTILGDRNLSREALKALGVGIGAALVLSVAIGAVLQPDPAAPQLAMRADVSLADIVLALAAGAAGALAYTTGIHTPLVGVMVAVALLPPLVAVGLLLGSGETRLASEAALLFLVNLICINLAGVGAFLARGIRPRTWWEAGKARKAARHSLVVWVILLLALVALILISHSPGCRPPVP